MMNNERKEEECPVCYCSKATRKLTCGHSFCKTCVKEWYVKCDESPTCPMCRKDLYFKGMEQCIEEWNEEHTDAIFQRIFDEEFENIIDYGTDESAMYWLEILQDRLNEVREFYEEYDLTQDDIEEMLWDDEVFEEYKEDENILRTFIWWTKCTWEMVWYISTHSLHRFKHSKEPSKRDFRDPPMLLEYIMIV